VKAQTPPIPVSGANRRSTRISKAVPLIVAWADGAAPAVTEETETLSINCHGFRYFARQRPPKNAQITFQIVTKDASGRSARSAFPGRVAWSRKSQRLDGFYLVGIEFGIPLNIWDVDGTPEDWEAFSPPAGEDPASFLVEVDRRLACVRSGAHYRVLGVEPGASRVEVKRRFYQLASRFHPDHHMDRPEWSPRLSALMEGLTIAYKTLSDDATKAEYDARFARGPVAGPPDARRLAQESLDKAQECIAEKNLAGCILWLHRAIDSEPNSSSHRALLGQCLSAIPEYRREAVQQFERAIELDPRNLAAHLHYGELLEHLRAPARARSHYLCVLELEPANWEALERLRRMALGAPLGAARTSLLGRLTGRRRVL
jgi:hypothetical protein